jgi:FkbM family methyltransferase
MQSLLDRRLPLRTRIDLLVADARRKWARRELYGVRYGKGHVYLSDANFGVDRATFTFAVTEASYATEYGGTVVLDVGSHKGYYAAYAAAHGARAIVAFEPESTNLGVLERTAVAYRSGEVAWTIRRAAVDATAGQADLHVLSGSWGHALEPPASFAEHQVGIESVPVVALADALDQAASHLSEGRRLVVKVNIEGAECSAILGTPAGAWKAVDEVFVETHPWADCDAPRLAGHLQPAGLSRVESAHPAVLRMRRGGSPRAGRRSDPR